MKKGLVITETFNTLLNAKNETSQDEEIFLFYLDVLRRFEMFIERLPEHPDVHWIDPFQNHVCTCYDFINGSRGYQALCDRYPIQNEWMSLGIDYMNWMARAFDSSNQWSGPVDLFFSLRNSNFSSSRVFQSIHRFLL